MKKSFQKTLFFLRVLQETSNVERKKNGLKLLGKGYSTARRLNPFNPLSYLFFILSLPILLVLYGVIEFFKICDNPFKWD